MVANGRGPSGPLAGLLCGSGSSFGLTGQTSHRCSRARSIVQRVDLAEDASGGDAWSARIGRLPWVDGFPTSGRHEFQLHGVQEERHVFGHSGQRSLATARRRKMPSTSTEWCWPSFFFSAVTVPLVIQETVDQESIPTTPRKDLMRSPGTQGSWPLECAVATSARRDKNRRGKTKRKLTTNGVLRQTDDGQ